MTRVPEHFSGVARTACETVDAIRNGKLSARDALEERIAAVGELNPVVNAVTATDFDRAREAADATDKRVRDGADLRPLEGLPMTIKEVFDLEGLATTWGDPVLLGNLPNRDAGIARRLKRAGAVIFARTNIPERMKDWETANTLFGPTCNPWNTDHSAGASSGGSAAAVASGLTPVCIGSDMGGSIRMPAHYCGTFAIKPTWNILPVDGHSLTGERRTADINASGPIARTADDLALIVEAVAGPDEREADGWHVTLPRPANKPAGDLKLAALLDHDECPIDGVYADVLNAFVERARNAGVSLDMDARPDFDLVRATEVMNLLVRAETATMLDEGAFSKALKIADASNDGSMAALNARGNTLRHRDWLRLHEERIAIRDAWHAFFKSYDGFLCPAGATTAPPLITGASSVLERTVTVNGAPIEMIAQHFWMAPAGMAYLPAVVLPLGLAANGLPAGIQLVGPAYHDLDVIAMAGTLAAL